MDLHGRIMNIPVDKARESKAIQAAIALFNLTENIYAAIYQRGHRDARHAAAELVAGQEVKEDPSTKWKAQRRICPKCGSRTFETSKALNGYVVHHCNAAKKGCGFTWEHWETDVPIPEWATKIFTCPKCGSNAFGTDELDDGTLVRHCNRPGCGFRWDSVEDDNVFYVPQAKASMTGYGGYAEDALDTTNVEQDLDPLRAYEVELGLLPNALTLIGLIASHQYLRCECIRLRDDKQTGCNAGYTEGLKDGKRQALSYEHVLIDHLRKMTIDEFSMLIREDANQTEEDKP